MRRLALLTAALAGIYVLVSAPFRFGAGLTIAAADNGGAVLTGAWRVGHDGVRDVRLDGPPPARLFIDGQLVSEQLTDEAAARTILVSSGYHAVRVELGAPRTGDQHGFVQGPAGGALTPVRSSDLSAAMPWWPAGWSALVHVTSVLAWLLWIFGAALLIAAARRLRNRVVPPGDPIKAARRQRLGRAVSIAGCAVIVTAGALLRIDAITSTYGPVESPRWLRAAQESLHNVVPSVTPYHWRFEPAPTYAHADGPSTRYRSDPYTYLKFARGMRWFYSAHYREPVFPFATKLWLWALRNQDVAVSFTSVTFSVLAIVMIYLVGSLAFGRAVGLVAAALLAIEHNVVWWDIAGWRDTAFMCAVLVVVHALLRFRASPTTGNAIWLGAASGLAVLVRITALSLALPALLSIFVVWTLPRRERAGPFLIAALAMTLVVGPYLFNCWRVYGDPLYAINVHTSVYQATEGAPPADVGAVAYVESKLLTRPFQTIETGVYGLTAYPFLLKWRGFWPWWPPLGPALEWLAIAGLLVWCFWRDGRVLLILLACSLVPFAFTWTTIGDWRFTEHAYPFYLLAACAAVAAAYRTAIIWRPSSATRADRLALLAGGSIAGGMILLGFAFAYGMPPLVAREMLAAGQDVSLTAGPRDAATFRSGWSDVFGSGNVTMRVITGEPAVLTLPLPDATDVAITIRADPFPVPAAPLAAERQPSLALSINGVELPAQVLQATPGRVGAYRVALPKGATRRGDNRLELRIVQAPALPADAVRGITEASTAAVWYVRVHPPIKN